MGTTIYEKRKTDDRLRFSLLGGLDTSVILGWLMDQGYRVHAVYVDLGNLVKTGKRSYRRRRTSARLRSHCRCARGTLPRFLRFLF